MAINVTSLTTSGQAVPTTNTPSVYSGQSLTFTVVADATGGAAISYQWQISSTNGTVWNNLSNGTNSAVTITNIATTLNNNLIRCVLTANSGAGGAQEQVSSDTASPGGHPITLTVIAAPSLFVDDNNLLSYTVNPGGTLNLTVDATTASSLPEFTAQTQANIDTELTIQWQQSTNGGTSWTNVVPSANLSVNSTILSYPTSPLTYYKRSTISISNIATSQNGYRYRAVISYLKDGVTASNSPFTTTGSTLVVTQVLSITKQPGTSPDVTTVVSYSTLVPNSGLATLTANASTTATTGVNYLWSYTLNNGTSYTDLTTNPQIGNPPFQLLNGTNPNSATLQLSNVVISNSTSNSVYGFRVTVSGNSGETTVVSNTAYITVTQSGVGLITNPSSQTAIEDKYGDIGGRNSYPEAIQNATFSAAVNINAPDGLKGGPITLQWQRKYNGSSTWNNVGNPKIVFGTNDPPSTSTNPNNPGAYNYTTVPLRRDIDNLSQYRLSVTYPTGVAGVNDTIFSSPATLNVFRTAYISNNPSFSSVYNNENATLVVTAAPSSGTNISYQWEHSSNGLNWFTMTNTIPKTITSLTRVNYTVTATCSAAHGFVAGDVVFVEGSNDSAYNGRFVVLSTGLTSTQFQYLAFTIPTTSPASGTLQVSSVPKYSGVLTDTLIINTVTEPMPRKYFRCIISVPDSLSTVTSQTALITILADSFTKISSINDQYIYQFDAVSWTVTAESLSLRPVNYQWQYNPTSSSITSTNWTDISGANSSTYGISSVQPTNAGFYRCKITNGGSTVSQSNAAKLTVYPVSLTVTTNIPTTRTILESSLNNTFSVAATSSTGNQIEYFWEIKPPGGSVFGPLPAGFGQTSNTFQTYVLSPLSRINDNGSVIRCRMNSQGVPGYTYSNECTITVDRRFYYFADAATKTIPIGQQVTFDLQSTFTGDELPTYQWQSRPNSSGTWTNISGETNPSYTIIAANVVAGLNNSQLRCLITFNQVTTFQYYQGSNVIQNISPAGTPTPTATITLNVVSAVPVIPYYSKQRQKSGAAIGTIICVPKPAGYVNNPAATTDDAASWKVALTGQSTSGTAVQGVSATTAPYGANDRFPGFIEMRGQILKARDFPELARIMGTSYGGSITGNYPLYNTNDTFRLPCPYGMKIMGTGNVNNNLASPSVVPLYGANSTPGGSITQAGSMGGVYNFEKLPQLPPGSPGQGTGDGVSSDTFTIGVHRTDGWENCQTTASTTFTGQFTWQVSNTSGIGERGLGSGPPHTHSMNTIRATNTNFGAGGGGSAARYNNGDSGQVLPGPEGVTPLGRAHKHGLSFTAGTAIYTPPGGGGGGGDNTIGDVSFNSPGTYSFTLPANVNSFTYNIKSGAGGAGGVDSPNPGGSGGQAATASGSIKDIPPGTTIGIKLGTGGGGGYGCAGNATGGNGGNSGGTGFGGAAGGNSGPSGCSGSGGGGGGASFMYIQSLGSGANPQGLVVGDILVIVGGGGGGGGAGHHGGTTQPNYPGGNAGGSWASSSINSSSFYTNQSILDFTDYSQSTLQSGKNGSSNPSDGGGGGGGGGGYTGGNGGGLPGGDVNAFGGSAGTSAYRSANHNGTPSIGTAGGGGSSSDSSGTFSTGGAGGSLTASYAGGVTTPPVTPGGINNPNHDTGIGDVGAAFLTETVDLHSDSSSTAPSMGLSISTGEAAMSTKSRTTWDSAHTFYLRNNEVLPMIQPYFRLKYMIKAF